MEAKQVQAKLRLAESYAALVEEMSDENITVNMIAVNAGKHRKTFYYHFNSKEQLVIWLFRYDLAKGLTERFDEKLLVSDEDTSDEPWSGFPFYVRNVKDSSRIYNTPFSERSPKRSKRAGPTIGPSCRGGVRARSTSICINCTSRYSKRISSY